MGTISEQPTVATLVSSAPNPTVMARWLDVANSKVGKHLLYLLTEYEGARAELMDELREVFRSHYVAPDVAAKRLAELGAPKTAQLLREHVPSTKTARSGDLGEVLATEIAETVLRYSVPIRRLRWKDGREMALRGDDVVGVRAAADGHLEFLKGESKSRVTLATSVLDEAGAALDRDGGRPSRNSVLFVADRLREFGDDALALQLENAVLDSFSGLRVEHFMFTVSGGDPGNLLRAHLKACAMNSLVRHAAGVEISDHAAFTDSLFGGL